MGAMTRFALLTLALGLCTFGATEIRYEVTIDPDASALKVRMTIPNTQTGATVRMPNWAPGSYRLADNHRLVRNLKATDGSGQTLNVTETRTKLPKAYGDGAERRTIENEVVTWTVQPAAQTVLEYDVATVVADGAVHWSGPSTYLYEVNRIREACDLVVKTPEGWPVYAGLQETAPGSKQFKAPDYDVLADNPVSAGDLKVITYTERGRPHEIVIRGRARNEMDLALLEKACRDVTLHQTDFFKSTPYEKYVWHFNVTDNLDGAGGLEHLSSTQITLASGLGIRAISVIAHEFFHLWNVKRIRSKPLGPFDYTKLPETGALWWMEGVTDYYCHYLLHVYGWAGRDIFMKDIVDNLGTVRRNPARMEISPYDASLRVGEAANGRGNSGGYRVNYYSMGWICGMILDLEMRARTEGKHSLDDVMLALWEMTKDDQPGFEEDEIRKQLIRFGGDAMGEVYDNLIRKPGEVPVELALAKAGLKLEEVDQTTLGLGALVTPDPTRGTTVGRVTSGPLLAGDAVKKIAGVSIEGSRMKQQAALRDVMAKLKAGENVTVEVVRSGSAMVLDVPVVATVTKVLTVKVNEAAEAAQRRIGEQWLAARKLRTVW